MIKKLLLFLALLIFVQIGQSVTYLHDTFPTDGDLVGTVPSPGPGAAWQLLSGTPGTLDVVGGRVQITATGSEDGESDFA